MKVVHLSNASRASAGVTQGLIALKCNVKVSKSYKSLGEEIFPASMDLQGDMKAADFIFLSSHIDQNLSDFMDEYNLWSKSIHYDYRDTNKLSPIAHKAKTSFKRSLTNGENRNPIKYDKNIIPIAHCALNEYYLQEIPSRDKNIGCFFNQNHLKAMGTRRAKLIETMASHQWENSLVGHSTGQKAKARHAIQENKKDNCFLEFIHLQNHCKIIFTAQPTHVEGDNRTWEAMASGALVFMDIMYHPMQKPLIGGKHCFYHDATKIETIEENIEKAKWYLKNNKERERIAKSGYHHTKLHHRPINRVKQMLGIKMA